MGFKMTTEDIEFSLEIRGYIAPPDPFCWDDNWCRCDMRVNVGDYLDYSVVDDEFLACCEVPALSRELEKLLNGEITKDKSIGFTEPDLTFELHPKSVLGKDEIDVCAELMIALRRPDTNYNGAVLALPFSRDDLESLSEYLKDVIKSA
ncbi:MAG: hypothetical protein K2J80_03475 [Oscillospiraceae bacterium]|nr:hypothetical protein [Oscillospiraceae bacterium]